MFSEDFRIVEDLHGELARRRDDDGANRRWADRLAGGGFLQQRLVERDEERGGLAGAGLRLPGNILAGAAPWAAFAPESACNCGIRRRECLAASEGSRPSESKVIEVLLGFTHQTADCMVVTRVDLARWHWGGLENGVRKRYKVTQQRGHSHPQSRFPDPNSLRLNTS